LEVSEKNGLAVARERHRLARIAREAKTEEKGDRTVFGEKNICRNHFSIRARSGQMEEGRRDCRNYSCHIQEKGENKRRKKALLRELPPEFNVLDEERKRPLKTASTP